VHGLRGASIQFTMLMNSVVRAGMCALEPIPDPFQSRLTPPCRSLVAGAVWLGEPGIQFSVLLLRLSLDALVAGTALLIL
jgi:hypothetical protein